MNNTSKNRKPAPSSEVTGVSFVDEAKSLLARCLVSLNDIDVAYFYEVIGTASIPGSLSHLFCVTDDQLMTIYRYCGFYNVKRNCFSESVFRAFIEGLNVRIDITRYKKPESPRKSLLVRIGQGLYPLKPFHQVRDELQPPNHRLKKEERQLVDSLLKLCSCQEPDTTSTANTSLPSINATIAIPTIPNTSTMCQKFNIHTPDKAALVMELVGEMKSPEKVPVWLGGESKVTIHSLNNKTKRYIHVPQCTDGDSAHTALRNYKVVEQIVTTVGGGVKSPEGLDVGALWFGKRLAETNPAEFTACSPRAGITVTARMSPEATAAMWNSALVTKTKQRKISKHFFFDWFGQSITAKEK